MKPSRPEKKVPCLPQEQRSEERFKDTQILHTIRCEELVVRMEYINESRSLQEALIDYFTS